jgi:hypothetical protein
VQIIIVEAETDQEAKGVPASNRPNKMENIRAIYNQLHLKQLACQFRSNQKARPAMISYEWAFRH